MTEFDQIHVGENTSQIDVITSTLMLLRRIRGFSESLRIGDPAYTPAQRRQFLLDAELIGSVCARFLIVPPNEPVVDERDEWLKMMGELSPKYSSFPAVTRSSLEEAADRTRISLNLLSSLATTVADPDTQRVLQQNFLDGNETGLSLQDLLDYRLAVFSPIATDYLQACLLQRFIMVYLTPDCFRLKPVILNRYLEPVVLPDCDEGQNWMVGINRSEVFVENSTSYGTMRATLRAVRGLPIPMPLPV